MPKMPVVTAQKAIRAFKKAGFEEDHQTGSHCILKKPGHRHHLSVPFHKGKTLPKGTIHGLIKSADLSVDQFIELLD